MKKIKGLLFFVYILISIQIFGQNKPMKSQKDLYIDNDVCKINITKYDNHTDFIDGKNGTKLSSLEYDNDGNMVLKTSYFPTGNIQQEAYAYDEHGRIKNRKILRNGNLYQETRYYFDDSGEVFSEVNIQSNGQIDSSLVKTKSKIVDGKKIVKNKDGVFAAETVSQFDSLSNEKIVTVYGQNGKVLQNTKEKFDDNGLLIEKTFTSTFQNIEERHVYEYNEQGQVTSDSCYNRFYKIDYYEINKYDKKGLKISESRFDRQDELVNVLTYEYEFCE